MQDESIVNNVKRLVNGLGKRRRGLNPCFVRSFYDHLLNYKHFSNSTVTTNTIICHLRFIQRRLEVAERLENLIDEAEQSSKDVGVIQNVVQFLCCLNNICNVSVDERLIETILIPLIPTESNLKTNTLKLENILVLESLRFNNSLNTKDFPVLPNSNRLKDVDEGYEEGSPSGLLVNNAAVLFAEPKFSGKLIENETFQSIWDDKIVLSGVCNPPVDSKIYLSEAGDEAFHEFYLRNYLRPLETISNTKNVSEFNINEFQFTYFKTCVRNLLFGVESNLFPFDEDSKTFHLRPRSCLIGISIETLVLELIPFIDAGKKFFFIFSALNRHSNDIISPILQTFYCSIRNEMNTLQVNIDEICCNSGGVVELLENLKPVCQILNCIYDLIQSLEDKLDNLDTVVVWLVDVLFDLCTSFNFCSHNLLFKRIFGDIFLIYFSYIENWIYCGRCEQIHRDFFVLANENYLICRDPKMWTLSFHLVQERVPSFMKSLSGQIFNSGKLTCLMNSCSVNTQDISSVNLNISRYKQTKKFSLFDQNYPNLNEFSDFKLDFCDSSLKFEQYLNDIISPKVRIVQGKAMKMLLNDCKLVDVFSALRQIYLGANGFFTTSLVEILFPLFQKIILTEMTTGLLCPLLLTRALDQCIESSSVDRNLLTNVSFLFGNVEKTISLKNINFFDLLELHCEIPWPCNLIVTDSVLVWLKKLFRFLISVRWTVWCLNDVWNFLKNSESDACFLDRHKLMLCQREMKHFVQQLEIYVLHQTVDVCWSEFKENFESTNDFDAIFSSHKNYVTSIVTRCLMNPKAQPVYDSIRRLLECILNFRCRIFDENEKKAFDVYEEFKTRSKALINVINKLACRGYQPHLAELLLRLNFNEYYFNFS